MFSFRRIEPTTPQPEPIVDPMISLTFSQADDDQAEVRIDAWNIVAVRPARDGAHVYMAYPVPDGYGSLSTRLHVKESADQLAALISGAR